MAKQVKNYKLSTRIEACKKHEKQGKCLFSKEVLFLLNASRLSFIQKEKVVF